MLKRNYIPESVKKQCVEMALQGMTYKEVYKTYYSKHYNTKFSGFRSGIKRWKKKYLEDKKYIEETNFNYGYGAERVTVQRDSKGDITQTWIKYKEADEDKYKQILDAINIYKPKPIVKKRIQEGNPNRALEINFPDLHLGENFYEDYQETIDKTVWYIQSRYWENIHIILGEDTIDTETLKGYTSNDTYIGKVDMIKAYKDCLDMYSLFIEEALANSETVNVWYSIGNHSETSSLYAVLALERFYGDQATFDVSLKRRKRFKYHDVFVGFGHAERGKTKLRDVRDLFWLEWQADFASSKHVEIHLGHKHSIEEGDAGGCVVRRLPTRAKTNEWSYNQGYIDGSKTFKLFEYGRDRLLAVYYV